MKRLTMALLVGASVALGGCSKEDATGQNVAVDINDADPSDIEAVPADETADGTEEAVDANAEAGNAN